MLHFQAIFPQKSRFCSFEGKKWLIHSKFQKFFPHLETGFHWECEKKPATTR
jgi:hypothetical protein